MARKSPDSVLPRDVLLTRAIEGMVWLSDARREVAGLTNSTPYQARMVMPVGGGGGAAPSWSSVISIAMRKNLMASGMS